MLSIISANGHGFMPGRKGKVTNLGKAGSEVAECGWAELNDHRDAGRALA